MSLLYSGWFGENVTPQSMNAIHDPHVALYRFRCIYVCTVRAKYEIRLYIFELTKRQFSASASGLIIGQARWYVFSRLYRLAECIDYTRQTCLTRIIAAPERVHVLPKRPRRMQQVTYP
jgi:hypothetical protein